jgi:hypothetical protein
METWNWKADASCTSWAPPEGNVCVLAMQLLAVLKYRLENDHRLHAVMGELLICNLSLEVRQR